MAAGAVWVLCGAVAHAADALPADLTELSIEQLMDIVVTSVSKKEESQFDAAAAISALSNEDLARAGVGSVAEALRLVPGMDVAAVSANQWAISARGFNNLYANKLLVLVDGRAVYTPQFAGVYWDLQQSMLDDVDRIEAIRGPGGTLWGANAVNGVINVVSRSARETQGALLYGGGGDVEPAVAGARYGGRVGDDTWYRAFASYRQVDDFPLADGSSADDNWSGEQAGFRFDGTPRDGTQWTWQGDATLADLYDGAGEASNVNTLGRWSQRGDDGSRLEVQAYYDRTHRDEPSRARSTVDTADLALQQTLGVGPSSDVVWGLGYRYIDIRGDATNRMVRIRDRELAQDLFSAFVQHEHRLLSDRLKLAAGVKLEHNDYTGLELQPSVRAIFAPTAAQRVWSAVSRAVRTPDVVEGQDAIAIVRGAPFSAPDGNTYVPVVVGNPDLDSEVLWAYELGYRLRLSPRTSLDLAAFYNDYRELIGVGEDVRLVPGTPTGTAETRWRNNVDGETHGGEIIVAATPLSTVRLSASYALLLANLDGGPAADTIENGSPKHQVSLRSGWDFTGNASADAVLRHVSGIEAVPAYVTADLRLVWRPRPSLELSLVGRNLFDDRHPEQAPVLLAPAAEAPRAVMAKVRLHF
ncbi:MAG: TonB-dependent receptor [Sinimarinibacterium sp.]